MGAEAVNAVAAVVGLAFLAIGGMFTLMVFFVRRLDGYVPRPEFDLVLKNWDDRAERSDERAKATHDKVNQVHAMLLMLERRKTGGAD